MATETTGSFRNNSKIEASDGGKKTKLKISLIPE